VVESVTAGGRIRYLRTRLGLRQGDLGAPNYSGSYISLVESGQRQPTAGLLEFVARRLGTTADYLSSGIEPQAISRARLQMQSARRALSINELPTARKLFAVLSKEGLGEIRNEALWGLAEAAERDGSLDAAAEALDALEDSSRRAEPGAPGMLRLLTARCRLLKAAGDYPMAIDVGDRALVQLAELGLAGTDDHVRLVAVLVPCYWSRGDLISAHRLAAQSIAAAAEPSTRTAQAEVYWRASMAADAREELPLALDLSARALAMLAGGPVDGPLAGLQLTRAWLLLRWDPPQLDDADEALAFAHTVMTREPGHALASCETEMARSRLLRGDPAGAIGLADRAIGTAHRYHASEEAQHGRVVRGLALIMAGSIDQGAASVTEAAAGFARLGERLEAARAWRDMAEALLARDQGVLGVEALRRAADLAGAAAWAMGAATGSGRGHLQSVALRDPVEPATRLRT
jgi:transcriptional regulator with XRE-family HTH domain